MKRSHLIGASLALAAIIIGAVYFIPRTEEDPITRLMNAAGQPDAEQLLDALTEETVNVNSKDWLGRTPLFYAARYGCANNVQCLLEKGADVNATDPQGMTPLYAAAWFGHTDCVQSLLKAQQIDVNLETVAGETAYQAAGINGHEACRSLLEKVRRVDPVQDALTKLAEKGIDSEEAYRRSTFSAILNDDAELLQLLLNAGVVDPLKVDYILDLSPLDYALECNSPKCTELLRQAATSK